MSLRFRVQLDDTVLGEFSEASQVDVDATHQELHLAGCVKWEASRDALLKWRKWSRMHELTLELFSTTMNETLGKYVGSLTEMGPVQDNDRLVLGVQYMQRLSAQALELWQWFSTCHGSGWRELASSQWPLLLDLTRQHNSQYIGPTEAQGGVPYVVDLPKGCGEAGFYLALGEALNGPGGYYGASFHALIDCTCGGFGPVPPFHIELRGYRRDIGLVQKHIDILREWGVQVRTIET